MRAKTKDESGAALILAIGCVLFVSAIVGVTLSMITSGMNNRRDLDTLRNRQYAADAGVEFAITEVRKFPYPGPGQFGCDDDDEGFLAPTEVNDIQIRVECTNRPAFTLAGGLQRNVVFNACLESDSTNEGRCPEDASIIRAQVNFEAVSAAGQVVPGETTVQYWSVNR
jgi:hypothetical protein